MKNILVPLFRVITRILVNFAKVLDDFSPSEISTIRKAKE
jgi:hypothetical protein